MLLNYYLLFLVPIVWCKVISTSYGALRSSTLNLDGQQYYNFLGVPHLKPPTGELRFKLPQPPEKWTGIRDATKYRAACPSNSTVSKSKQKWLDEDCLYLNIFTSKKCLNNPCPVIFYIHGGVLNYDSAVQYNASFITETYSTKDIVFVLPAMRLGVLGLLALEDENLVPKNLALYDIIAALEFTNQEIHNFGGIPNEVTLMGHSMGGGLVKAFAFSKLIDPDRRLFQRSISLSGGVNFKNIQEQRNAFKLFIRKSGCFGWTEQETVDCLRSLSWERILQVQSQLETEGTKLNGITFGAPIMQEETTVLQFQTDPPVRDMILSSTEFEFPNSDIDSNIGFSFGFVHCGEIRKKYYADEEMAKKEGRQFDSYESHLVYMGNVIYGRELKRLGAKVYLFEDDQPPRSVHSSDLPFIIGAHMFNFTEDDRSIAKLYIEMFTNFAYGNTPATEFDQFDATNLSYYSIIFLNSEGKFPSMKTEYHREDINYWERNITELEKLLNLGIKPKLYSQYLPTQPGLNGMSTFLPYFILLTLFFIFMTAIIGKRYSMRGSTYVRL